MFTLSSSKANGNAGNEWTGVVACEEIHQVAFGDVWHAYVNESNPRAVMVN